MAKSSSSSTSWFGNNSRATTISEETLDSVKGFFEAVFVDKPLPDIDAAQREDSYSDLIRSLLQIRHLRRGHVSCLLSVKPAVANFYGSLHGGAVAAVAETLSFACARTVVAEDKDLFLGELAISYLSTAPQDDKCDWDDDIALDVENTFRSKAKARMTDWFTKARKRGKAPEWMNDEIWDELKEKWVTDATFQKFSQMGKQNRASNCGGRGTALHT